jgi:hypothetical protein
MGRTLVLLALMMVTIPTGQTRTLPLGGFGHLTQPADWVVPNMARTTALVEWFFGLVPTTPFPDEVRIILMSYEDFEVEVAKHEAGPMWRDWLRNYNRTPNNYYTILAFIRPEKIEDGKVEIVSWQLSDDRILHELSHYHCRKVAVVEGFAMHDGSVADCMNAITYQVINSKEYRKFLREQPWLE